MPIGRSKVLAIAILFPLLSAIAMNFTPPTLISAKKENKDEQERGKAIKVLFPLEEFDALNFFRDSWDDPRICSKPYKPGTPERREHRGIDLPAREDTPVRAMSSGRPTQKGALDLGGNRFTYFDIEQQVLVYGAHFREYAKNLTLEEEIKAGDIIAYVGDTGSICGIPDTKGTFRPELHIGLYKKEEAKGPNGEDRWTAFNPYLSLRGALEKDNGKYMREYYKKYPRDLLKFFQHHPEELVTILSSHPDSLEKFFEKFEQRTSALSGSAREYQRSIFSIFKEYFSNTKQKNLGFIARNNKELLLTFFQENPLELIRFFDLYPSSLAQFFDQNGHHLINLLREHSEKHIGREELEADPNANADIAIHQAPKEKGWDWWFGRKIKAKDCAYHHKGSPNYPKDN